MIILIVLTICLICSFIFKKTARTESEKDTAKILICTFETLICLCFVTIAIMSFHTKSMCRQYKASEITIDLARLKENYDRIGVMNVINDNNRWLVSMQYYNRNGFDLWIPDEVDNLKFMK